MIETAQEAIKLTLEQEAIARKWLKDKVYPKLIEKEKNKFGEKYPMVDMWKDGKPLQEEVVFTFHVGKVGLTVMVEEKISQLKKDLTDTDSWKKIYGTYGL